jgi:hypothetical protein
MWKVIGTIAVLIVIIFAGGIGKLVGKSTSEQFFDGKREGELNSVLMQAASQINENLPIMVDSETRLDSSVGVNKQFRYNYTLINYSAEELDIAAIESSMRPQLINTVCTTKEMRVFVENGVPVTYAYYGKDGKQVTTIAVQPSDCGGIESTQNNPGDEE